MKISRDYVETDKLTNFPLEDRLFKLPIDKFVSKINDVNGNPIELLPIQVSIVNAIQNPKHKVITCCISRRVGKTFLGVAIATLLSFEPYQNIVVIAPNYTLSDISFSWIITLLKQFGIETETINKKDRLIKIKDSQSEIRMVSSAKLDNALGRSNSLVILDEIAIDNNFADNYFAIRPTLDRSHSKLLAISTPRSTNWFKTFYDRGWDSQFPEWVSIHGTYHDNPRVIPADISEAKRTMSKAHFQQEYLAAFTITENQIYEFDTENDIIDFEKDFRGKVDIQMSVIGYDVGYRDPCAACVLYFSDDIVYCVDEYYKGEESTATHAKALQYYSNQHDVDIVVIDSAAAQFKADLFSEYDLPSMNAKKAVLPGIEYVKSIIEHHRLKVDKSCTHFLDSILKYRWDPNPNLMKSKPLHDGSDMMDALRYALYTLGPGNLEPFS